MRPNVNFRAIGSAGVNEGAREKEADIISVRRARERANILSCQKLLGKRDPLRTNSSKPDVVEHKPTIDNSYKPKPNVRLTYLPVTGPRSKSGHDKSNAVVTLSSLKHMSISNKSSALPIDKRTKTAQTVRKTRNKTMSHTNNYGKVSNPARPVGQEQGSNHLEGAQGERSTESNTPQRHGSYTLITPNSTKRNKVLTQASKEASDYASYKESRRVNYVKTEPQTVGGTKSEEEIRKQRERDAQNKKYEMIMKRRKWEAEKKEREEAEYREKKERAREQARRNEQRKKERQGNWTEDHRRTNEAFLRRLEQQNK